MQEKGIIISDLNWKNDIGGVTDAISSIISLWIVASVSWLSSREIEKSLRRARKSEADLKDERDSLEIKVEERTRDLKRTQMEKMSQLYRFAEFGRLSSGIFHDLVNPLTAVSLNLGQIKETADPQILHAKSNLSNAILATRKMEDLISSIRKQIRREQTNVYFSLADEIIQVIQIFSYKSAKAGVEIIFTPTKDVKSYGDPVKFSQLITNIISNAIDAYDDCTKDDKKILVKLIADKDEAVLTAEDWGCGVPEEIRESIFEPFYTTKGFDKGTGIGLSSTKNITEKSFGGKIELDKTKKDGARFIITIPIIDSPEKIPYVTKN